MNEAKMNNNMLPPTLPIPQSAPNSSQAFRTNPDPFNVASFLHTPPIQGPALGPALEPHPSSAGTSSLPETKNTPRNESRRLSADDGSLSPYSWAMNKRRELTMPPVPNFDIPPPPQETAPAAIEAKFKHFLQLKSKGLHFNNDLDTKHEFKDPAYMEKRLKFAGVEPQNEYECTLSKDCYDTDWPEDAYYDKMKEKQVAEAARRREARKGQSREFVRSSEDSQQ